MPITRTTTRGFRSFVVWSALLASGAPAQIDEAFAGLRRAHYASTLTGALAGKGRLELPPNSEEEAMALVWHHRGHQPLPDTREVMPFSRAGGIAVVDDANPSRFLVSGFGPTEGWLVLVSVTDRPQPAITTLQKIALAGVDPLRITWTDDTIFLIDGVKQRVAAAPWNGSAPLPTAFETILDRRSHAGLLLAASLDLSPATPDGVLLSDIGCTSGATRIHRDGATWASEPVSFINTDATQFGLTGDCGAVPSVGPLTISGPAGSFEIVDGFTGTRVGSGTLDFEWQELEIAPAHELVPGHRHLVTSPGREPFIFFPTVRHGTPSVAPGFAARLGRVNATRIGDTFAVATRFERKDTSHREVMASSLWVSLRDVTGNDPVSPAPPIPAGTAALLSPLATIDDTTEFSAGRDEAPAASLLAVESDASLEGLVLLYQFVALTPDERSYVASDVFGTTILAAGTDLHREGRAEKPPRVWADMSLAQRTEAYAKGAAWLARLSQTIPGRERTVRETIEALR